MLRVPGRRTGGQGVVVKSIPNSLPQRVVSGPVAAIQVRPMPAITVQSQPKYQ